MRLPRQSLARISAVLAAFSLLAVLGVTSPAVASDDPPTTGGDGEQIADAAVTFGSNGLYVGPDDKVYIASVGGDEITVHDPNSGYLLDRIGPERGVNAPDDLFITGDGTIYWTEIFRGNVGMLKPNGESKIQFVGPGVNPITMSDDGRLFVARVFLGDGLYELDPDLEDEPRLIKEDTRLAPDAFAGLNGMDFGPDGLLYAPAFGQGVIVSIDVDQPDPDLTVVAEGFAVPAAVAFSPAGELHAVDLAGVSGKGQVVKVDMGGTDHEVLIEVDGTLDNLAFDRHGRIFAAEGTEGTFVRWSPDGEVRRMAPNGLTAPGALTFGSDGRLWVADNFSLRGYGEGPTPEVSFHDRFLPPGVGFAGAGSVAADGDNLIISWSFGNSVQVFDPATGAVLQDIRSLAIPINAIRHGDVIAAVQAGAANVVNAETGDVLLQSAGLPFGLTSDGTTLYVGDWALGTITAVGPNGTTIVASGLAQPEGMTLTGNHLLVVEAGSRTLTAIDLDDGSSEPLITELNVGRRGIPGFLPVGFLSDVVVHPKTGDVYVSSDTDRTVYRFDDLELDDDDNNDDDDNDNDNDNDNAAPTRIVVEEGESIQAALDQAGNGTRVIVRGAHNEAVWIKTSGVSLIGQGATISVPAEAADITTPCNVFGQPPTAICVGPEAATSPDGPPSPDQYLENVTVRGFRFADTPFDAIGSLFTNGITVRDNVVERPGCDGVFVIFAERFSIRNNTVAESLDCNGINVQASTGGTVANNVSNGNSQSGVSVGDVSHVTIRNNQTASNCNGISYGNGDDGGFGIRSEPFPGNDVRIVHNVASGNNRNCEFGPVVIGGAGILIGGANGVVVANNTTNDNVVAEASAASAGIVVTGFPNPDGSSNPSTGVVVRNNTSLRNSSPAGPLDLLIDGEDVKSVRNNNCGISQLDAEWCNP